MSDHPSTPPPAELNLCTLPTRAGDTGPACGAARYFVAGYLLCPRCDAAPGHRPSWLPKGLP